MASLSLLRDRGWSGALAALALAGLAVACGAPQYQYIANRDRGMFFRVPNDWHVFDAEDVLEQSAEDGEVVDVEAAAAQQWAVVFDADPQPSLDHASIQALEHPIGLARIRELAPDERDAFSLQSLRNELVPLDEIATQDEDAVTARDFEEVLLEDGQQGIRFTFDLRTAQDEVVRYEQLAFVDAATRYVYLMAVGCSRACFEERVDEIRQITDSWTLREPRT